MKEPLYLIQATIRPGEVVYVYIDGDISFVSKSLATLFKSKMLAFGWLIKAKVTYKRHKFTVITL